jgi:lysophospholipase L1-like esterase
VLVADTYGLLGSGDLVGGTDCLHPNDAGHQRIAEAFAAALAGTGMQTAA